MAQNNPTFVFVWKTLNDSSGRPNLRIVINQVTNLKSLGFTWRKLVNLLKVSTSFWSPYFCNRPFCGRRCCKTSVCNNYGRSGWFACINSMKLSAFIFPSYASYASCASYTIYLVLESSLSFSCWRDGCWFSFISFYYHVHQIYKWLHDFFWGILAIHDSVYGGSHWPLAVFTVLAIWLLGRFVLRVYLQFHY